MKIRTKIGPWAPTVFNRGLNTPGPLITICAARDTSVDTYRLSSVWRAL